MIFFFAQGVTIDLKKPDPFIFEEKKCDSKNKY